MKKKFLFIIATAFALLVTLASCSVYSSITKDKFVTDMTSVDETKIPAYNRCVIKHAYSIDGRKEEKDPDGVYSETYVFNFDDKTKTWVYTLSDKTKEKELTAAATKVKPLIGNTYANIKQDFPDEAKYSLGGTNYKVEFNQYIYYFNNFGYLTGMDQKSKSDDNKNVEVISRYLVLWSNRTDVPNLTIFELMVVIYIAESSSDADIYIRPGSCVM